MCICACKMELLNEVNSHSKLIYLAAHLVLEYTMIVLSGYPSLQCCNLHAVDSFCSDIIVMT